jgi:hypothetical protein
MKESNLDFNHYNLFELIQQTNVENILNCEIS